MKQGQEKDYNTMEYNLHFVHLTSFEVIKIELLDFIESNSSTSAPNHPNSQGGLIIRVAKILQNVEKSYDKGKFLLEESKKSDGWDAIFRRF